MSITTTKQFIDFLFLLSKFNFSKNKPRTFFRFLAYSSVYTVLSAFNFFTSSRESPEILAISSRAYFPAASIRSATSFKDSILISSIILHISLTPFGFSFRYRVRFAINSKFISSALVQLKSCMSFPIAESPRYSPFT